MKVFLAEVIMKDPFFSFYQVILCVRSLHIIEHFFNKKLMKKLMKSQAKSTTPHKIREKNNKLLHILEEKKTAI